MIFGEELFADQSFADAGHIATPVIPPVVNIWEEQCPVTDNFISASAQGSTWNNSAKQSGAWIEKQKNLATTNECETG